MMLKYVCAIILWSFVVTCIPNNEKQDRNFWYKNAKLEINARMKKMMDEFKTGEKYAKNVILLLGDGMGMPTLTAARIFKGQQVKQAGEDSILAWEKFPTVALAKTYNLDAQVGESSACATALLCGVKANFETVGLDSNGRFENCFSSFTSRVDSLIDWAQQEGKSTGIVTNTRLTHATPAPLYSHSASRYWEDDSKVPQASRKSCKDIARQLVEDVPGKHINVLLGGGRRHWLPKVAKDPEDPTEEGRRLDGRNLIDDWIRDKKKRNIRAEYVWHKSQLDKIEITKIDQLLGLFAYSHMDFETDRKKDENGDPSLSEMTKTALNILQKNSKGFFLFIESGRIDHAHHYNNPYRALEETLVLENSLLTVLSMVNLEETLVLVTTDHSHVLTFGGVNTPAGNNILGMDKSVSDVDGMPYTTLLYSNGPGFSIPRSIPTNLSVEEKNSVHGAAVPRKWATHGGEDVPIYAIGPLSHILFTGTIDQSYIPHAIAYIACYADYSQRCIENVTTIIANTSNINNKNNCNNSDSSRRNNQAEVVLASSVLNDENSKSIAASIFLSLYLYLSPLIYL